MATESGNSFIHRYRVAITVGACVAAVVLLVLLYKVTAPQSSQNTTPSGEQAAKGEVLQVGALPVT